MKLLILLIAQASALQLTPDNWDSSVAGKTVFIKFFAPWCGHCKKMKPAWDKLMEEYEDSEILVGDVDCVGSGKPLCDKVGVQGFPTIKYGDPDNLEPYQGARDFDALKEFTNVLKPPCDVRTFEHCSVEDKVLIDDLSTAPLEYIKNLLDLEKQERETIEKTFDDAVKALQDEYQKLQQKKKDDTLALKKTYNVGIIKKMLQKGKDEL